MTSAVEPKSSRPVVVHRVRAREPWVIATFLTLLLPTVAIGIAVGIQPLFALMMLFGLGSWIGFAIFLAALFSFRRSTRLDVDPRARNARASKLGLFVDQGPALPRASIASAFVSPSSPNGAYVKVFRRLGFPVELWTADVEGAHALVAGLGLDASRVHSVTRGTSPMAHPVTRILSGIVAIAIAVAIVRGAPLFAPVIGLLAIAYAAVGMVARQFVVGADGVLVRWFGRRISFTPIADIASVELHPGRVRLVLRSGEARDLVIAKSIGDRAANIGMEVSALGERIRSAMRRAGRLEVDTSALERGDRNHGVWIATLRDLARGTGYRAAVQREDLVFLVEDARTAPTMRIAAAIALGEGDEHERARLRIAAESSSLPEVEEALEAVLAGEEEKLESALRRVESAPGAHSGASGPSNPRV